jgi:8-oxo-dGTP pyrophosphatase MutT (NUDIX family)
MPAIYQAAVDPDELAALEARWGVLAYRQHRLAVDHPFLTGEHQMLVSDGRRAEICYVMHRGDPAAGLLLHIKTFYPSGAYRLPTGGIHVGETVQGTLAREIHEETGLTVGPAPDQVQVQRCLGVVAYTFDHRTAAARYHFATYHFLVQMPPAGEIAPLDPSEQIGSWQWQRPDALDCVAARLEGVGQSRPEWGDWGLFRALSHRFVAAQLGAAGE